MILRENIIGLNVFIFQIHDRDIQHSTIINRGFERKPKAYRVIFEYH